MASTKSRPFAFRRPVRLPFLPAVAMAALVGLTACDIQVREGGNFKIGIFSAQATQEWTHTYSLNASGHIEIANLNGPIELTQGAAGSSLDVRADITAKALTDAGAKDILSKGKIEETVTPERVKVETVVPRRVHGSYEVRYQVRLPPGIEAQVSTTNGSVKAIGLTGKLKASIVNGEVEMTDMAGALDAAVVNGSLTVKLSTVSAPVRLETTNGRLMLELPQTSKANLSARVVNGGLTVSGLPVEEPGQRRIKNLEAALNGGGPSIDLRTTNGRVTITGIP
jgi:hypothetical protein